MFSSRDEEEKVMAGLRYIGMNQDLQNSKIEMCKFYTTTGYPTFKPRCEKGLWASLRCHSENKKCPKYEV